MRNPIRSWSKERTNPEKGDISGKPRLENQDSEEETRNLVRDTPGITTCYLKSGVPPPNPIRNCVDNPFTVNQQRVLHSVEGGKP